jgi:hypothetical protein
MTLSVFHFPFFIQIQPKLAAAIFFHTSSCIVTFGELTFHFSLLSIHPQRSFKSKYIKVAFIRRDHIRMIMKVKILYLKVITLYKVVSHV